MTEGMAGDASRPRQGGPRRKPHATWEAHVARLLELDPALAQRVNPRVLPDAVGEVVAAVRYLRRGDWCPGGDLDDRRTPVGLLVLDGVLTRTACLGRYRDVEIVGAGDVVSPWRREEGSIPVGVEWRVLEDASVAILDRTFELTCARYPSVLGELAGRAVQRAQRQALQRSMSRIRGLDLRILVLLWYLADRWGRVASDGVVVPLRLSQEVIADLVGARRPSVCRSLARLERGGRLRRRGDRGWLLLGLPPNDWEFEQASPDPGTVTEVTGFASESVT